MAYTKRNSCHSKISSQGKDGRKLQHLDDNKDNSITGSAAATQNFHNELTSDLIPAVEGKYHTYAQSTTPEGLKAARSHRAFGGFSMGSVTTWYSFIYCLDYFKYFMPMSGDCWIMGV